jgi:hypothetical protein
MRKYVAFSSISRKFEEFGMTPSFAVGQSHRICPDRRREKNAERHFSLTRI